MLSPSSLWKLLPASTKPVKALCQNFEITIALVFCFFPLAPWSFLALTDGGYWGCFWCVCDRYWSAFWLAERLTPLFHCIFPTLVNFCNFTILRQAHPLHTAISQVCGGDKEGKVRTSFMHSFLFIYFFHFSHFSCEQLSPTPTNSFEETLSESVHRCSHVNNACRVASRYEKPSSLLLVHIAEWHIVKTSSTMCLSLSMYSEASTQILAKEDASKEIKY